MNPEKIKIKSSKGWFLINTDYFCIIKLKNSGPERGLGVKDANFAEDRGVEHPTFLSVSSPRGSDI